MNLMHLLAEKYLWEYHETFSDSVLRWFINIGVYGAVALAVCGGLWQAINASSNKPAPGRSPDASVDQPKEKARAANPTTPNEPDPSGSAAATSPLAADLHRAVPEAGVIPTAAAASVAGSEAAERLQKLNHLRDQGLVSAEIYEAKRQQILQTL